MALLLCITASYAQAPCTDDYFSARINTPTAKHNYAAISTPADAILLSGYVLNNNTLLRNGWLTQLSAQGSLLWSKQYNFTFYQSLDLRAIINAGNNTYLAGGFASDRDTINNSDKFRVPYLLRLDEYGNAIWGKYFEKSGLGWLQFNHLLRLNDGHFMVVLSTGNANLIMKIDADGHIKWSTGLYTLLRPFLPDYPRSPYTYYDFPMPMAITQLRNGQLVVARSVSYLSDSATLLQKGVDLFALNPVNGDTVWRKTWLIRDSLQNNTRAYADVKSLVELPSGELSCISSYGDISATSPPYTSSAINYIFSAGGTLKKALTYTAAGLPLLYCTAASANTAGGEQLLLLDDATAPMLLAIDAAGGVQWANRYPTVPDMGTNTLVRNGNGNYIFSSLLNGANKNLSLIKTDPKGNMECLASPVAMTTADRSGDYFQGNRFVPVTIDTVRGNFWPSPPGTILVRPYAPVVQTDCRKTCCRDTTGPAQSIDLCEGKAYTLPNNYTVTTNGDYPILLKTAKGCDSIIYYTVRFSSFPVVDLGYDQCLEDKDSVILATAPGYASYNWMGTAGTLPTYTVKQPGSYRVSVTNGCGTARDTVDIFQQCEFDTDMPNAFTPNGDFLNDTWGITRFNKNRLISLVVYNRWGQQVFKTTRPALRWDGTLGGLPQSAGVYIYYLQMETLNGKPRRQKGFVTIVR